MTQCLRVDPERESEQETRHQQVPITVFDVSFIILPSTNVVDDLYIYIPLSFIHIADFVWVLFFLSLSLNTNIDGYHGRERRHSHTTTRTKNHEYHYHHHHCYYHWSHYHHRKWWPSLVVYQNSEFLSVMSISFHTQHNRATTMVEYHSPRTISMLMNRYGSWYQMNPLVNIPYNNWYIPIDCNVDNGSTWPPSHSIQVSTMAFGTPIMPMVATIATWTWPWDVLP